MSTVDLTPTKIVSEYDQEIQQSQIFFSKIYPDAHVSTKINTFTVCKGVSEENTFRLSKGGLGASPHELQI